MKYRLDKYGNQISQLGYGCMRFTKKGTGIDYEKAERELLRGYEQGINYYDTAYIYPGSEECLGKILEKNGIREKVNIATKLPQYMMKNIEQVEKVFREELTRLRTDYIDYYLMHMFTDITDWEKLQSIGIEAWIEEKKKAGTIRQIGFSFHGDTDTFLKILNCYDWDFCQIQYNYLDETSQAGRIGLEAAYEKRIPVIIMEPLRGGKLVNLPTDAMKLLSEDSHHYSAAEFAFRWLWNQPGVTCILSGMNSAEMVDENCKTADLAEVEAFSDAENKLVEQIKAIFKAREKVGCTGCRYCMPCPKGVDIPGNFYYYNLMYMEDKNSGRFGFAQSLGMRENPGFASQCVKCGLCERHCPQHIPIREKLEEADKNLRPFPYKVGIQAARSILKKNRKKEKD